MAIDSITSANDKLAKYQWNIGNVEFGLLESRSIELSCYRFIIKENWIGEFGHAVLKQYDIQAGCAKQGTPLYLLMSKKISYLLVFLS